MATSRRDFRRRPGWRRRRGHWLPGRGRSPGAAGGAGGPVKDRRHRYPRGHRGARGRGRAPRDRVVGGSCQQVWRHPGPSGAAGSSRKEPHAQGDRPAAQRQLRPPGQGPGCLRLHIDRPVAFARRERRGRAPSVAVSWNGSTQRATRPRHGPIRNWSFQKRRQQAQAIAAGILTAELLQGHQDGGGDRQRLLLRS